MTCKKKKQNKIFFFVKENFYQAIFNFSRVNEKKISHLRRPKRIVLIRHGESEGNVDQTVYGKIPDNLIHLSELGIKQAKETGKKLKELIGNETVQFFYSPYKRSEEVFSKKIFFPISFHFF